MILRIKLPKGHGRKHHEYVLPVTGEQGLWQAVLARQIRDCFGIEAGYRQRAIRWLFTDNHKADRDMVCDFAGINFDSWSDELRTLVDYMEDKSHCDLCPSGKLFGKREVAKYVAKMFMRHGRNAVIWQEVVE